MSLQKAHRTVSKALRDSARGEACTVRIPGVCDGGGETTVLAHLRMLGGGGASYKPSDLEAVDACGPCHDAIDGRTPASQLPVEYTQAQMYHIARALVLTHRRMAAAGLITVKGAK